MSLSSLLSLIGCEVRTSRGSEGNKDVDINTPFGAVSLQSRDLSGETGLLVYPGARPIGAARRRAPDNGANISVSSTIFGMKVVARRYKTTDPLDKVVEFYANWLKRFGKVIRSGELERIAQGRQKSQRHSHGHPCGVDGVELKVGPERNRRIVTVQSNGRGSVFGLVHIQIRTSKH